jgi:pimeloyl-ACP methyl ester carboxylesterase
MPSSPERVILVHGLWMPPLSMAVLGYRLRAAGFDTRSFGYPSVRVDATGNARRLAAFALGSTPPAKLHLVGHSLGGVLTLRALADSAALAQCVSRVLLLGTPYADSGAAHALARLPGGQAMIGRTLREWLAGPHPLPDPRHEVGVIAGTRPLGLSRLLVRLPGVSDGAVSLDEARVPGARDLILVPVAHSALPISRTVADEVIGFLRDGRFSTGARRA